MTCIGAPATVVTIPITLAGTTLITAAVANSVAIVVAIDTVNATVIVGATGHRRRQDFGCSIEQPRRS